MDRMQIYKANDRLQNLPIPVRRALPSSATLYSNMAVAHGVTTRDELDSRIHKLQPMRPLLRLLRVVVLG